MEDVGSMKQISKLDLPLIFLGHSCTVTRLLSKDMGNVTHQGGKHFQELPHSSAPSLKSFNFLLGLHFTNHPRKKNSLQTQF